jgi:hypothetical protein
VTQRDVTELAGPEAIALEQLAVDDDPRADAAADADDDKIVRPRPAMERQLRERGRVAVVRDDHRHVIATLDERPESEVGPVQVHRPSDGARPGVDDARRADADPEEWRPGIGVQGVDKLEDEVDGGFAVAALERQGRGPQDLATEVDDGAAETAPRRGRGRSAGGLQGRREGGSATCRRWIVRDRPPRSGRPRSGLRRGR